MNLTKTLAVALALCAMAMPSKAQTPEIDFDCSQFRGFNYTPAGVEEPRHHVDTWVKYDEKVAEFDLDLAQGLKLNFARVFVPYQCYTELGDTLATRLQDFARKCNERGIKFMPVVGSGRWTRDASLRYQARPWVEFLVNALKDEPNLIMWDLMNEPDLNMRAKDSNFENCKLLYGLFKELDPETPVTIGMEKVSCMIEMADYADVLQFHNYSETRAAVADTIARAQAFAEKVGKQVFNGEMGCVARANPYDVTIEEHMKADCGWVLWELMIVRKGWGIVHGVFYEDGTVRDPSIPAAILGYFRNRDDILLEIPDKEGKITSVLNRIEAWNASGANDFETGINTAEVAANMLEAAQLAPMHESPNYLVDQLRKTNDICQLKTLLERFYALLEPYRKPAGTER